MVTAEVDALVSARHSLKEHRAENVSNQPADTLKALAERLRLVLGVRCIGVCRTTILAEARATIVACAADPPINGCGDFDLNTTPCSFLSQTNAFFLEDGVRDHYPHARIAASVEGRSYGGVRCVSPSGAVLGILFFVHDRPMAEDPWVLSVLRMFADEATRTLRGDVDKHPASMLQQQANALQFAMLGEIAAEVAHEINQPMFAIGNYAKACLNALGRGDARAMADVQEWLTRISKTSEQPSSIVQRLRAVTERGTAERQDADVGVAIRAAVELIGWRIQQSRVAMVINIASDLPRLHLNTRSFQLSLISLIHNACDAIDAAADANPTIEISSRVENDFLAVRLDDTGVGITDALMESVFDRFVTTKPEGMGLGLSVCRSFAEEHGGILRFQPKKSAGTCVEMLLPIGALRS